MKQLLRAEHWLIQQCKFDRMSNNLYWIVVALLPCILALMSWLLHVHERAGMEFLVMRDLGFTGKAAEVYYERDAFYFRPLRSQLLLNFKPVSKTVKLAEGDLLIVGRTMLQVSDLDGWTPNLRTIGYYLTERDLSAGASIGRSPHPEEANQWNVNDIIAQDTSVEPVHVRLARVNAQQYRLRNLGVKGFGVPAAPPADGTRRFNMPEWTQIMTEATLSTGQKFRLENTQFELMSLPQQEALELKIARGAQPTYTLSRNDANMLGGLRMFPNEYIPDYLVDERFLEYVRQAIEAGLFGLDDPAQRKGAPQLRIRGFDAAGTLAKAQFDALTPKEKQLLHQIFRFREDAGQALRWRRPFNREGSDPYVFSPAQTENFIISEKTNTVRNIYQYAAYLTNPHVIAEELATTRGEIFDRDHASHAKLIAYFKGSATPLAELLLVPSRDSRDVLPFNTQQKADTLAYVAGGYRFSDGATVVNDNGAARYSGKSGQAVLRDGQTFSAGQYTFRYAAPGKGMLAQNLSENGASKRYYPLGSRLAHLLGYSFARSQFKGNLEKVFDKALLGLEQRPPWWSLRRATERKPGNNLILTIDDDLQRVVYAELSKKLSELNTRFHTDIFKGAAIVLNTEGEILASATLPSYNPNDLRSILSAMQDASDDPWNSAYINRATQKSFPPGSTMKVIMSTLALDKKAQFLLPTGDGQYHINNGGSAFVCTGNLSSFHGVSFGKYGIPDFGGSAHGELTLDTALTKSCNNTFAFLALSAGWQTIQAYAERYGFNRSFDFLPYQMFQDDVALAASVRRDANDPLASLKSQVPTPKEELKLSQLARMGIGQWDILATPLQMATVAMTVGNLGLRPYPHILAGIVDGRTGQTRLFPYPRKEDVFSEDVMLELFPMMQHVVQTGSAARMAHSSVPYYSMKDHVAGKTGTAEIEDARGRKYNVVWFISFIPVEQPQLALAVVIEKGPIISGEAVDVARGIWEKAVLLFPKLFVALPES